MVDPGGVRQIPVAARYGSISIKQLVQPARQINTPIAPQRHSVTRKRQISGESFAWIKVLCETNATPQAISEVQTMLHKQGYYQGSITGSTDADTETAIARYQQQMNIPHGGFLSLQTIESLRGGARPTAMVAPAQNTGLSQQVTQEWSQAAPAQYAYQNTYQNSGPNWNEASHQANYQASNWSNSSLRTGHGFGNQNISTPLLPGELPTNIIAEQRHLPAFASDSGIPQERSVGYLSWVGK
jgi:peptidoglycan hydrolase-like protein with peptidoglycan-binding domain